MRVVFDTCVMVAAMRSRRGASYKLVGAAIEQRGIIPVLTDPLFYEYLDVLQRPEHQVVGWTYEDIDEYLDDFLRVADTVIPRFSYRPLLEDEGDELVAHVAINGDAKFILTFNTKHFHRVERFGIRAVTPGKFLGLWNEKDFAYGTS